MSIYVLVPAPAMVIHSYVPLLDATNGRYRPRFSCSLRVWIVLYLRFWATSVSYVYSNSVWKAVFFCISYIFFSAHIVRQNRMFPVRCKNAWLFINIGSCSSNGQGHLRIPCFTCWSSFRQYNFHFRIFLEDESLS